MKQKHIGRCVLLALIALCVISEAGYAQKEAISKRPGDMKLDITEKKRPFDSKAKPKLSLPPVTGDTAKQPTLAGRLYLTIKQFEFNGNTIYTDQQLEATVSHYKNRKISNLDLEELRLAITNQYINNGYINSGATIPDQDLQGGKLILNITEGTLTQINLKNDGRLDQSYLLDRISSQKSEHLNIGTLQERLYLLQQNPRIKRINAALGPGLQRGQSILDIMITEDQPYHLSIEANNYRPPSIGEGQLILAFSHNNVSGVGDTVDLSYNKTAGFDSGRIAYAWPLLADDTMITANYQTSQSKIIDDAFEGAVSIDSESYSASLGLSTPLFKSSREEYIIGLKLNKRQSQTFLDDQKAPLSPGAPDGNNHVTALRLTQSWVKQDQNDIYALRHTLSAGINALNSTVLDDTPDSRFTTWLIQYQWAKRHSLWNAKTVIRTDLQLANEPLLSMEQFAIGGARSVRGYRENQIVRDNGFVFSAEGRIPVYKSVKGQHQVEGIGFYDFGRGWNGKHKGHENVNSSDDYINLESAGVGIRYRFTNTMRAELYWAHALNDVNKANDSLQDDGIHISIKAELL